MRKVVLSLIALSSFFIASSQVNAQAQRDEIDYEITSIDINNDSVTVNGWAIVGGHNNYGGVLTNIKVDAKSPNRGTTINGTVTLSDSGGYGDNTSYTGSEYCWERNCSSGTSSYGSLSYKGQCFYRNMHFKATFHTRDLQYLGAGVYFVLTVEYNKQHDSIDRCSTNNSERGYNSNILNKINQYNWGYRNSEQKIIAVDQSRCKVNGSTCSNSHDMQISGKDVELKVTNTGNTFRLNFDTDFGEVPIELRDIHKELVCTENEVFQSVIEDTIEVQLTAEYDDTDRDSESTCGTRSAQQTMSAEIYIVQSGRLEFTLDQGPIFSGGSFPFGFDYTNTVRWYYGNNVEMCPKIEIPNAVEEEYQVAVGVDEYGNTIYETRTRCTGTTEVYSEDCQTEEDSKKLFEEAIAARLYKGVQADVEVELPKDSNSVKNSNQTAKVGSWECEPIVNQYDETVSTTNRWEPGIEWTTKCHYTLPKAMLNKQSADVEYGRNYTSDIWMDKGNVYFIPLKWPTGTFPIKATLNGLSATTISDWTADYTCEVETIQLLYDLENGGYKFFYRPIMLNNPFPDRDPSTNWLEWWNNEANREQLANSYNNLEYKVGLTPNSMRDIRDYNNSMLKNGDRLGYLDYSINASGTSEFFNQNFIASNFSRNTSDYSRLGEMNE